VSAFLPAGVDAPGLLTAAAARGIWKQLEALPDAPPPAASGKASGTATVTAGTGTNGTGRARPQGGPVDLGAAAAGKSSSRVPF
jgi:hypothetical protein